ncbi:histone modifying enzyme [Lithospermum erythrorhizon]|uniref:histone deacetylase n=1 Tax=Lithospermum erythrorhizon TaxID=34254 RepID=A0AAV3NRY4_LITER
MRIYQKDSSSITLAQLNSGGATLPRVSPPLFCHELHRTLVNFVCEDILFADIALELLSRMGSSTLQMSHPENGNVDSNIYSHKEQKLTQEVDGTHGENGSLRVSFTSGEAGKESSEMPNRDSDCSVQQHVESNSTKRQTDVTLEEMYNNQYDFDEDEEDCDWQPIEKHVEIVKWFCVNCTMANLDGLVHCDVCGEHRQSGILRRGFFASPYLPDGGACVHESDGIQKYKDSCFQKFGSDRATLIGFDERMLLHEEVVMKSHPHPERPDRLRAIAASLETAGIFPGKCYPILAREITKPELEMVHALENIEAVDLTSRMLASYFTPDTYANEHSACAARLAAGLCSDLASAIFSGQAENGFALVRPPGHHAGVKHAMGFCLHNNAAVAASAAQVAGAKKVLIVDWDVHHGNGTQEIFDQSKSVLYVSLHRHEGGRFYPGTGAAHEVGSMGAEGYCVNIPWSRGGVGDNDYIFAFQHIVLPIASEYAPDFTIISAGFDAARGDPLGCCDVTPAGYAQMTHMLRTFSSGKLLVILEGGYNLRSISSSAAAVIKVLLGESPESNLDYVSPSVAGLRTTLEVLKIQKHFWPSLEDNISKLQSELDSYDAAQKTRKRAKKKPSMVAPVWWKWGKKRILYKIISKRLSSNTREYSMFL